MCYSGKREINKISRRKVKGELVQAVEDVGLVTLNKKLDKKLLFFRQCENTKWKDWEKKFDATFLCFFRLGVTRTRPWLSP